MKTVNDLISEIESTIFDTGFSLITEYKTFNQFFNWGILKNKSVRYILTLRGKSVYLGNYILIDTNTRQKQVDSVLGEKEVITELENILRLFYSLTNPLKNEVLQLEDNFRGFNV